MGFIVFIKKVLNKSGLNIVVLGLTLTNKLKKKQ